MFFEEKNNLDEKTLDMKRAIDSLKEEMEAVDSYNQRADATNDSELKQILQHNADEEKEHASMLIEWIRRNDPTMDKELKDWVFTEKAFQHE
ncbi:MAG: ferritin family protein [Candidatus Nanoarchaeia archaeon]